MLSTSLSYIVWDVAPEIIKLTLFETTIPITWYGLLFMLAFVLGQRIILYIFRKEGKPISDVDTLTMYAIIGTIVGARLGHFLFYEWELLLTQPGRWISTLITPPFQGLASHGAIITILLALYMYSRKKADQSFFWIGDRVAIAVSLGGALIRMGNLFNSEIYGKPTTLPWGFLFVRETDPDLLPLVPRHPTQLYESLFCLILLGLTFYLWKQKRQSLPEGFITGIFMVLLFSFRFLVEFLKNDQSDFEGNMILNMGQVLSIPAILTGICILLFARRNEAKKTADGILI